MHRKTARRMPKRSHTSFAEAKARREERLDKIRTLLVEKAVTAHDLVDLLGIKLGTAHGYLLFLAEVGEAHNTKVPDQHRRQLWAAGRAPGQDPAEESGEAETPHAVIVPARQVGMWRHWMDVAFFGPARVVA